MGQFFRLDSSFATKLGVGAPRAKSADLASPSVSSTDPSSVTTSLARAADPPTGVQVLSSDQIIPSDPSIAASLPKSNLKNLTATDDGLLSTVNIDEIRANHNEINHPVVNNFLNDERENLRNLIINFCELFLTSMNVSKMCVLKVCGFLDLK
jgi:hypothetical protein